MSRRNLFFALILIALSAPGLAGQWCSGTISTVYLSSDGSVIIYGSWRNDYTKICNDQGTFGGIDGVTCLAWYATAVKAQGAQTKVTVYYDNDGGYTCANMPTYSSALVPFYFMVSL
jgi:hypothetical protein